MMLMMMSNQTNRAKSFPSTSDKREENKSNHSLQKHFTIQYNEKKMSTTKWARLHPSTLICCQILNWSFTQSAPCLFSNFMSNPNNLGHDNAKNFEWWVALSDIAKPNRTYKIVDGISNSEYSPTDSMERKLSVSWVQGAMMHAEKNSMFFFESVRVILKTKKCYTETMNLQIVQITCIEDVMITSTMKNWSKCLIFRGILDTRTGIYLKCEVNDLGLFLALWTNVVYCEGKTIDAPDPFNLAQFYSLFVGCDIVIFFNCWKFQSQVFCKFTFHQQIRGEAFKVLLPYYNRALSNPQYGNVKQKKLLVYNLKFETLMTHLYRLVALVWLQYFGIFVKKSTVWIKLVSKTLKQIKIFHVCWDGVIKQTPRKIDTIETTTVIWFMWTCCVGREKSKGRKQASVKFWVLLQTCSFQGVAEKRNPSIMLP